MNYFIVGVGGVIGVILRYIVGKIFREVMEKDYFVVILFINVIGSFLIGYLLIKYFLGEYKFFLMIGFFGGFIIYFMFMFEILRYIKRKKYMKVFIYVFIFIFFGIFVVGVGIWIVNFI